MDSPTATAALLKDRMKANVFLILYFRLFFLSFIAGQTTTTFT